MQQRPYRFACTKCSLHCVACDKIPQLCANEGSSFSRLHMKELCSSINSRSITKRAKMTLWKTRTIPKSGRTYLEPSMERRLAQYLCQRGSHCLKVHRHLRHNAVKLMRHWGDMHKPARTKKEYGFPCSKQRLTQSEWTTFAQVSDITNRVLWNFPCARRKEI